MANIMKQNLKGLFVNGCKDDDYYELVFEETYNNIKNGLVAIRDNPEKAKETAKEMIDFFCLNEEYTV